MPYTNSDYIDANGNSHRQQGEFTWQNGTAGKIIDVWLQTDTAYSLDRTTIEINSYISDLPQVTAFGNVHDLQESMALDQTGHLKALVEKYIGS